MEVGRRLMRPRRQHPPHWSFPHRCGGGQEALCGVALLRNRAHAKLVEPSAGLTLRFRNFFARHFRRYFSAAQLALLAAPQSGEVEPFVCLDKVIVHTRSGRISDAQIIISINTAPCCICQAAFHQKGRTFQAVTHRNCVPRCVSMGQQFTWVGQQMVNAIVNLFLKSDNISDYWQIRLGFCGFSRSLGWHHFTSILSIKRVAPNFAAAIMRAGVTKLHSGSSVSAWTSST